MSCNKQYDEVTNETVYGVVVAYDICRSLWLTMFHSSL